MLVDVQPPFEKRLFMSGREPPPKFMAEEAGVLDWTVLTWAAGLI